MVLNLQPFHFHNTVTSDTMVIVLSQDVLCTIIGEIAESMS